MLRRLAAPLVIGILSVFLFQIVDTWFIGQLGAPELAAMGFCFPVVFAAQNFAIGLGGGTSAVIARAVGARDDSKVRRLTTDAVLLALASMGILSAVGLMTIEPLFSAMGAGPELIPLITDYMVPIYIALIGLMIPMLGNAALRATGDTVTPSVLMLIAGAVNLALDPLLIFGLGPFPRLEMYGAGVATAISWFLTMGIAVVLLHRRRMLDWARPRVAAVIGSWREILYVGLPSAGTLLLVPVGDGILTWMVSESGPEAVGGFGVAGRIQSLALILMFALATAQSAFVGQNFGAQRWDRIGGAFRLVTRFSILHGLILAGLLAAVGPSLGTLFNDDPQVIQTNALYMWLVPIGYAGHGVAYMVSSTFNAMNRPLNAAALLLTRLFVLTLPLAWLGRRLFGLEGLLGGMGLSYLLGGALSGVTMRWFLRQQDRERRRPPTPR